MLLCIMSCYYVMVCYVLYYYVLCYVMLFHVAVKRKKEVLTCKFNIELQIQFISILYSPDNTSL